MTISPSIPAKHFYMIRHGQTEHNEKRLLAGQTDSALTDLGWEQARAVQPIIQSLTQKPKIIIHSHLSRARNTASVINDVLHVPMVEDPDYAEMSAGEWEEEPYEKILDVFRGWIDTPKGETAQEFWTRVHRAKKKALTRYDTPPLVVCHGGVFRAFWKLYDLNSNGVRNCQLYEFEPANIKNTQNGKNFPWIIWAYDQKDGKILRQKIDFDNDGSIYSPEFSMA